MGYRDHAAHITRGDQDRRARTGRARRAMVGLTAFATAAIIAVPASAQQDEEWGDHTDPWPLLQEGESPWGNLFADAQGTRRAKTVAPADPGVKWHVDLADVETSFSPEGYGVAGGLSRARGPALVSPEGTLIRTAVNNDPQYDRDRFGRELIGIDPDDGSVLWEIPHANTEHSRCLPAIDSQGRLWGYQYEWSEDERHVSAFDPETGTGLTGYTLEPDGDGNLPSSCRRTALHIGGAGDDERLVIFGNGGDPGRVLALDISGDSPSVAWQGVAGAEEITGVPVTTDRQQIAVFSDDAMFVAVKTGVDTDDEALSVVKIALEDGEEVDRIELPVPDDADGVSSGDYDRLDMLLAYDHTLVVATRGGSIGLLAGIDVTDGLSERWVEPLVSGRDPSSLALGAGVVLTQPSGAGGLAGQDRAVWGFEVTSGQPLFSGITVHTRMITDAAGMSYTTTRASGDARPRYLASMQRTGEERWRIGRDAVAEAVGVADFDDLNLGSFSSSAKLGPIDADGTMYIHSESATGILALDNSGGLAEFTVPFEDVDDDNVHAENIARLAARGITTGDADGNYDPAGTVTRAQFATFLARAFGLEEVHGDHFTDVHPDNVHAGNIYAVADAGITQGVTADTFDPNGTLPREQMASLLVRAFGLDEVEGDHFTDVHPDSVHAGNIYAAAEAGITQGTSETTFSPGATLRRDQMASLLIRGLDSQEG
jgi:hypothetical protein